MLLPLLVSIARATAAAYVQTAAAIRNAPPGSQYQQYHTHFYSLTPAAPPSDPQQWPVVDLTSARMVSPSTLLLLPLILFTLSQSSEVRVRRDLLSDILDGLGRVRGGRPPPPRRPQAAQERPPGGGRRRPPGGPRQPPRFSPPRRPNSQSGPSRRPQNNRPGPTRRPQNNRPRPSQRPQSNPPRPSPRPQSNRPGPPRTPTTLIFVDQPLPPVFQPETPTIKNIPSSFDSQDLVSVNHNKQIPTASHHDVPTTSKTTLKPINSTPPPSNHFQTLSTFRTPAGNDVGNELSNFSSLPFLESIPASQGFTPEISSPFSSFPRTSGGTSSPSFSSSGPSSSSLPSSGPSSSSFRSSGPSLSSLSSQGPPSSSFSDASDSFVPGSSAPSVTLPASSSFVNLPSQDLQVDHQTSLQDLQIQRQNPVPEVQFQNPALESSTFFSSKLPNLSSPSAPVIEFNLSQSPPPTPVRNTFSSPGIPSFEQNFGELELQSVATTSSPKSLPPSSSSSCRFCRVRSCFAQCR